MAIKSQEAVSGCWAKAADDEPVFVLRAQDELAPLIVRTWATIARGKGVNEAKILEALNLARQMEAWPGRRMPD